MTRFQSNIFKSKPLRASGDRMPLLLASADKSANPRVSTRMSGEDNISQNTFNRSMLTTWGPGGTNFTNDLKVIKQHLM